MKLRVGYISPDFHTHSVAYFIEPLLKAHNKNKFEIFAYYNNTKNDETTKRLKTYFDHWENVAALSDDNLADKIFDDEIDILVDLAGHSANNRLSVFMQKPAPIQATWLGYPNTSGISTIDYRITDNIADPVGDSDTLHTEKLIRLKQGFLCYQGDENLPVTHDIPFDTHGFFTFGSFNNHVKVTPDVIKVWAEILLSVPESKLIMKSNQFADSDTKKRCLDLFSNQGIKSDRLTLTGMLPKSSDHMMLYNNMDLALDPFPYNGTTTTCEALWMGVPTLTLKGKVHASRVSASILSQIDLQDYITSDTDEYIQTAILKSESLNELRELRSTLRKRMLTSSLCDSANFARQMEEAYQSMWDTYCKTTEETPIQRNAS